MNDWHADWPLVTPQRLCFLCIWKGGLDIPAGLLWDSQSRVNCTQRELRLTGPTLKHLTGWEGQLGWAQLGKPGIVFFVTLWIVFSNIPLMWNFNLSIFQLFNKIFTFFNKNKSLSQYIHKKILSYLLSQNNNFKNALFGSHNKLQISTSHCYSSTNLSLLKHPLRSI